MNQLNVAQLNIAKWPLFLFFLTLSCILPAASAEAQQEQVERNFRRWDKNDNQQLSYDEFYSGINQIGIFGSWDRDNNLVLDKNELRTGIYKKWERDGENFETGKEARFRTWARFYAGTFDDWDTDGNGTVTQAEFSQRVGNKEREKLAQKFDMNKDELVKEKEFYSSIFDLWDDDRNGYLSEKEFSPEEFKGWFL